MPYRGGAYAWINLGPLSLQPAELAKVLKKLEAVQDALGKVEVYLMTVSDVRGCGRQRGFTENYRGNQVVIRLLSKVKLEIAVNDNYVEPAINAIPQNSSGVSQIRDGRYGDWSASSPSLMSGLQSSRLGRLAGPLNGNG